MGTIFLIFLAPILLVLGLVFAIWVLAQLTRAFFRMCINKLLSLLGIVPPTP